jgi:hypothetical protein
MFKAILVEQTPYFANRRKLLALAMFPIGGIVLANILFSTEEVNRWLWPIFGLWIVVSLILWWKWTRNKAVNHLEITEDNLMVRDQDNKVVSQIPLGEVEEIIMQESYQIPESNLAETLMELKGKPVLNKFSFKHQGRMVTYNFETESHYMLVQLSKLAERWKERGVRVYYI